MWVGSRRRGEFSADNMFGVVVVVVQGPHHALLVHHPLSHRHALRPLASPAHLRQHHHLVHVGSGLGVLDHQSSLGIVAFPQGFGKERRRQACGLCLAIVDAGHIVPGVCGRELVDGAASLVAVHSFDAGIQKRRFNGVVVGEEKVGRGAIIIRSPLVEQSDLASYHEPLDLALSELCMDGFGDAQTDAREL